MFPLLQGMTGIVMTWWLRAAPPFHLIRHSPAFTFGPPCRRDLFPLRGRLRRSQPIRETTTAKITSRWRGWDQQNFDWFDIVTSQNERLVAGTNCQEYKEEKKKALRNQLSKLNGFTERAGRPHRMIFNKKEMDEYGEWQTTAGCICFESFLWN